MAVASTTMTSEVPHERLDLECKPSSASSLMRLSLNDVTIGSLLGKGAFASVYSVQVKRSFTFSKTTSRMTVADEDHSSSSSSYMDAHPRNPMMTTSTSKGNPQDAYIVTDTDADDSMIAPAPCSPRTKRTRRIVRSLSFMNSDLTVELSDPSEEAEAETETSEDSTGQEEDDDDMDMSSLHKSAPPFRRNNKYKESSLVLTNLPPLALKRLKPRKGGKDPLDENDQEGEDTALYDMQMELQLMARLPQHPNIVRLYGFSNNFGYSREDSFWVMEQVYETLQDRLDKNKKNRGPLSRKRSGSFQRLLPGTAARLMPPSSLQQEQAQRIRTTLVGVAKALQHMHKHNVIFRDLKPSNVGFAEEDGSVKLLDFGLARSCSWDYLTEEEIKQEPERRMTGAAGSARYMSPEVARQDPRYGKSADVYSLAILSWHVCTQQKPFKHCKDLDAWFKAVVGKDQRPSLRQIASPQVQQLLSDCWHVDPSIRPSMDQVCERLGALSVSAPPRLKGLKRSSTF